jgi:hypothetical protein
VCCPKALLWNEVSTILDKRGAEQSVKGSQTRERGPPSALAGFEITFLLFSVPHIFLQEGVVLGL